MHVIFCRGRRKVVSGCTKEGGANPSQKCQRAPAFRWNRQRPDWLQNSGTQGAARVLHVGHNLSPSLFTYCLTNQMPVLNMILGAFSSRSGRTWCLFGFYPWQRQWDGATCPKTRWGPTQATEWSIQCRHLIGQAVSAEGSREIEANTLYPWGAETNICRILFPRNFFKAAISQNSNQFGLCQFIFQQTHFTRVGVTLVLMFWGTLDHWMAQRRWCSCSEQIRVSDTLKMRLEPKPEYFFSFLRMSNMYSAVEIYKQ